MHANLAQPLGRGWLRRYCELMEFTPTARHEPATFLPRVASRQGLDGLQGSSPPAILGRLTGQPPWPFRTGKPGHSCRHPLDQRDQQGSRRECFLRVAGSRFEIVRNHDWTMRTTVRRLRRIDANQRVPQGWPALFRSMAAKYSMPRGETSMSIYLWAAPHGILLADRRDYLRPLLGGRGA